jgi:hypothetical protein
MSNKTTIFIIVSILIAVFAVVFCIRILSGEDDWICQNGQWVKHGNPNSPAPTSGCGEAIKKEEVKDEKKQTDNQEPKVQALDNVDGTNIIVDAPKANESIGLPLFIKGKARVFENTVSYRIKDSEGTVLLENYTTANSPDMGQFGPFEASVNYLEPKGDKGTVEVFEYSAKDGSEINKVEIPVVFKKVEATDIKIFFGNRKEDPDAQNCGQVYEIARRIPKTTSVAKDSLSELFRGTYATDEDSGYFSEINRDAKINKIAIMGGIAKVDFSRELIDGIEGSCEKETIKAQITETLKQFPTVKEVEITVDGEKGIL